MKLAAGLVPAESMTESSILAQNERWRRVLSMQVERMVSNTWMTCPSDRNSAWKHAVIPDETHGMVAVRERP